MGTRERPALLGWSPFALTWLFSVVVGWGLVLFSGLMLSWTDVVEMGLPLLMMAALVFFGELRPVVTSESYLAAGVPISTAFVFATIYLWGLTPALLLEAVAVLLSEMMLRKSVWKLRFNVGQYVISVTAAWLCAGVETVTRAGRWALGTRLRSTPTSRTAPPVGSSKRSSSRVSVVLPLPVRPSTPSTLPAGTSADTPRTTSSSSG